MIEWSEKGKNKPFIWISNSLLYYFLSRILSGWIVWLTVMREIDWCLLPPVISALSQQFAAAFYGAKLWPQTFEGCDWWLSKRCEWLLRLLTSSLIKDRDNTVAGYICVGVLVSECEWILNTLSNTRNGSDPKICKKWLMYLYLCKNVSGYISSSNL